MSIQWVALMLVFGGEAHTVPSRTHFNIQTMFAQALRVTLQLALFRGGPQDMPYSLPLTRVVIALAVFASVLLLSPVTPLPLAFATGIGGATGVAFFTHRLLRGKSLESRFMQTLVAQLAVGTLFALAMWPAFSALAPVMQELMKDGQALERLKSGQPLPIEPPAWAALWSDVLFIWSLAASARINRLAADLKVFSAWLVTLLSLFVLMGFVLLAQIIAALLFS